MELLWGLSEEVGRILGERMDDFIGEVGRADESRSCVNRQVRRFLCPG